MNLEVRHITEDERAEQLRLRHYGFADYPPEELQTPDLRRMIPEEIMAGFVDGRLVASVHTYRFHQAVRGVTRAMGGVAGVAAYPEVRRRGVVRRVMLESLAEMPREGVSVSMLHPFKVSFYRDFGYVTADDNVIAEYPASAFAQWLRDPGAEELQMERLKPMDAWEEYCHLDSESMAARDAADAPTRGAFAEASAGAGSFHGPVVLSSIGREFIERRLDDQETVLFRRGGRTLGGAIFRKEGAEPDGTLRIAGYRFTERDGLGALLRFIALHIDQCNTVVMNAAPASLHGRLFQHTGDIDGEVRIHAMRRPWMIRIVDVVAALRGIPAPAAGELELSVTDEHCPWNNGTYRLSSAGAGLEVDVNGCNPKRDGSSHPDTPSASVTIQQLSALLYGTHAPAEILRTAVGATPTAVNLLAAWFPERFLWNDMGF
ncbi:MAG: GNAT family N-acetyltransferase [Spirochaetota bacterium]